MTWREVLWRVNSWVLNAWHCWKPDLQRSGTVLPIAQLMGLIWFIIKRILIWAMIEYLLQRALSKFPDTKPVSNFLGVGSLFLLSSIPFSKFHLCRTSQALDTSMLTSFQGCQTWDSVLDFYHSYLGYGSPKPYHFPRAVCKGWNSSFFGVGHECSLQVLLPWL